jgi:alanyl-tRNA synthetase
MQSSEIRQKFLTFFEARGHTIVSSSSLIPDDPSVLLTTAGMQQFKKYFTGELDPVKDFGSKNTVSIQKSFRTSDIDEVGDESHLTFFEMLGNFSFGGYWKKEAIQYAYDFITKEMGLKIDYVTIFEGESNVPADEESEKIWRALDPNIVIKRFGRADNFWGPTGNEGPCGPTTEIYVNGIEIWNIVFNQYYQKTDKTLEPLKTPGIDTGMGLERLAMVAQNLPTIFETDIFSSLVALLPQEFGMRTKRIVADHARAIVFLISDGVRPSNKEAGYILRRLVRRVIALGRLEGGMLRFPAVLSAVVRLYKPFYPALNEENILSVFEEERGKFEKTLTVGIKELARVDTIDAKAAFKLFESYGLPYEIIKEVGGVRAATLTRESFDEEFKRHQEISRAGNTGKFGGHGIYLKTGEVTVKDESELTKVTRLHTATHLMHAALREVLGPEVKQNGSDITVERTRFDFMFPRKLTDEEIKKVEALVNEAVKNDLPVTCVEMPKREAEKTGALFFFRERYPEKVKVYYMGKTMEDAFSKEFCGGPHVTHTGEVGEFKIVKQESVGANMRRIRAVIN